jgi:hypothetical protein
MPARNSRGIDTIPDVTRTSVAMKQLSKQVLTETNTRNNNGAAFSAVRAEELQYGQKECLSQLSFETAASQDISLGAEKLK